MLPLNEIPSSMIVDIETFHTYYMSFNKKKQMEVGDYVILALDKTNENWRAIYPPCEVSSLDSSTLEFLSEDRKTSMSAAWEEFVHSKGKVNDFFFEGSSKATSTKDLSGWVQESSSILDYIWALPIILLAALTFVIFKKNHSKQ